MKQDAALTLHNLSCAFKTQSGWLQPARSVRAVDGISLTLEQGGVLGVVGESGCGKTTLARMILGLQKPSAGEAIVHGQRLSELDRRARAQLIQPVFQDPFSSLNPKQSIREIVALPLRAQGHFSQSEIDTRCDEILERVGLSHEQGLRRPAELSGGQRQRVAIARALILQPRIVVCDEPTSALDVSVQAQILNLLDELRRDLNLTYVFISHNLAVVEHIATEVMVMYLGRMVEHNTTAELFKTPRHPYTQALLASVLTPEPGLGLPDVGLGDVMPDPANLPSGCRFHPRCLQAMPQCATMSPPLRTPSAEARVECHLF
jgi:peptide/nickel transport system ATP-binding protein